MYGSMGGIGIANLAGSFIAFLATPVLSRLYSPEQLGLYFIFRNAGFGEAKYAFKTTSGQLAGLANELYFEVGFGGP